MDDTMKFVVVSERQEIQAWTEYRVRKRTEY